MSILLGPLSETMSNVSWRDCALAGDQIAGAAGSTLPAANAVIDLRNSRRFMAISQSQRGVRIEFRKGRARTGQRLGFAPNRLMQMQNRWATGARAQAVAGLCMQFARMRPKPWAARPFPRRGMRRARGAATAGLRARHSRPSA